MEGIPLNSISNLNYHDPNEKKRKSLMVNGTQEPRGGNTFGTGASIDRFSNPRKSSFFGSNRNFLIKSPRANIKEMIMIIIGHALLVWFQRSSCVSHDVCA